MFDHLGVVVSDLKRSADFYGRVLAPLGYRILEKHPRGHGEGWVVIGTGKPASPFFVVAAGRPTFWSDTAQPATSPVHICFAAPSQDAVERFHETGLSLGAR